MGIVQRLRTRLMANSAGAARAVGVAEATALLAQAEALVRDARGAEARAPARAALELLRDVGPAVELDLRLGAAHCFVGELDDALRHARAAALARPYDVDSRLALGNVRLVRAELDEAAHEFDAVIEEFGADPDTANGRRATILARGQAPVDELAAGDEEWAAAARLLAGLWTAAGVANQRLQSLAGGNHATLRLLESALTEAVMEA